MPDFEPLRKAMVVIAVSAYDPPYEPLPGTLTSARRIADWAKGPGHGRNYKLCEITDAPVDGQAGAPVTVERVRKEITQLLDTTIIDRLVVYFAGHGVVRSTAEEFWLLTKAGGDVSECIGVMQFMEGLKHYGIGAQSSQLKKGQLVIIADACRNVHQDSLDLVPNPILTRRGKPVGLQTDLFRATTRGAFAFQVNAVDGTEPYCLFSSVLCDALEGKVPAVIDSDYHPFKPVILNDALADYLDAEIPLRAAALKETMEPDNQAGIRAYHNYYDILSVPPPQDNWGELDLPRDKPSTAGGDTVFTRPSTSSAVPEGAELTSAGVDIGDDDAAPAMPQPPSPVASNRVARMQFEPEPQEATGFRQSLRRAALLSGLLTGAEKLPEPPHAFFDGSGPVAVPTAGASSLSRARFGWGYMPPHELRDHSIFVSQDQGWTLAPRLQRTTSVLLEELPGNVFLRTYASDDWDLSLTSGATMSPSGTTRVSDARRLADLSRRGKQEGPNNGIRAGYLYRFAGDDDNIVRTANYMAGYGLPFDLAALAATALTWRKHRDRWQVFADLPAVDAHEDDNRPRYAGVAFPARRDVPVWGLFPIHRQGWQFLADASHLDVPEVLRDAAASLVGAPAVVMPTAALEKLVEHFGYVIVEPSGT